MGRLLDHQFADAAEDEVSTDSALDKRKAKIAFFLRTDFFNEEFEPTLRAFKDKHEPGPSDSKEDMLYHIGVRDGINLTLSYLNELRGLLRGEG